MTKLLAFSVYDSKAEAYLQPFFAPKRGLAERMFGELVNDEAHQFCRHAEDYTLFEVGWFDREKGEMTSKEPMTMGNGLTFKQEDTR